MLAVKIEFYVLTGSGIFNVPYLASIGHLHCNVLLSSLQARYFLVRIKFKRRKFAMCCGGHHFGSERHAADILANS